MQLWGLKAVTWHNKTVVQLPTITMHCQQSLRTDTVIHLFATGLSLPVYIHVNISGASDSSKKKGKNQISNKVKKGKNQISNKVAAYKAKITDTTLCSDLTFLLFSGC